MCQNIVGTGAETAGDAKDGKSEALGDLGDADRRLTVGRLEIGVAFAGQDETGVLNEGRKVDRLSAPA